jgi:integrative and conjugative element protein (TIGR02256 family)
MSPLKDLAVRRFNMGLRALGMAPASGLPSVCAQRGIGGGVMCEDDDQSLTVEISTHAVDELVRRRQGNSSRKERGGQLFGEIAADRIVVVDATGVRPGDKATPTAFVINRHTAQREIDDRYTRGLHFVGDCHTHPVLLPSPSERDLRSMQQLYRTSRYNVGALLMLIIGTSSDPATWHCSLHNAATALF